MKAIGICLEGIEDIVSEDLKGKVICEGRVRFEHKKNLNFRGVDLIYELIKEFKFKTKKEILDEIRKLNFKIEYKTRL